MTSSSGILYHNNINPILNDERSVNLGTVYESLEVKSGKDYHIHSALNHFLKNDDYSVKRGIVFCNDETVEEKDGVT